MRDAGGALGPLLRVLRRCDAQRFLNRAQDLLRSVHTIPGVAGYLTQQPGPFEHVDVALSCGEADAQTYLQLSHGEHRLREEQVRSLEKARR